MNKWSFMLDAQRISFNGFSGISALLNEILAHKFKMDW